ncbi:MAG: peptidylprolyl isomerase [Alphaproteobacteria bacterium]|nr:peptidylprolyl isomerase [Alphaproteobacteria bacterium]
MLFSRLMVAATLALAVLTAAVTPTLAQTSPSATDGAAAPSVDPNAVVAKVGESEITINDLMRMRANLPAQYRQIPLEQIYPALLERAIDGRLVANAARATDIQGRPDVQKRIEIAIDDVLSEIWLGETIASLVTEEALRARYKTFAESQEGRKEAHARHILLENEENAKAVIEELDKGADFAALAGERSTGPSAAQGGDLGWFEAGQMVPEFSEAAFALEPGTYSKAPVKSQFGWHVILLEETRNAGAPPYEQVQEQLATEMTRELIGERLAALRAEATIERFTPTGEPMPAPGATSQ